MALRRIALRDFVIVQALDLDLQTGFTVLTGETGAGKSMLVDAIELLAGGRAGAEVVRAGAERAELSATVDVSASDLPDGMLMPSRIDAIGADRMRELGPGAEAGESTPALEREKLRDEVSSFVDSQPEEIAQLVQGWLTERNG